MKHPDFVAWMILYPIANAICSALRARFCPPREKVSDAVDGVTNMILVAVWAGIGWALW